MKSRKLRAAILSSITASAAASPVYADNLIEEIIVTATKRKESAQDIPVTVQALDASALTTLNLRNFDDAVRYLPNVTLGGRGPGQSEVYIRGMSIDGVNVMLAGAQGPAPVTAIYLDEQPVSSPGRNLDVYLTDMSRIEVLPGPQGTLFGASSMAGTVRFVTNKPVMNESDGQILVTGATTKDGDPSGSIEGHINVPLIDDKLAIRGVFYQINRGGYIDNVYGEFTPDPAINSTLPADAVYTTAENSAFVEDDFNSSEYTGMRLSSNWYINDNWELLLQYMHQQLDVDGVFDYDPAVGDLEVNRFFDDDLEDTFDQIAWTLEGRLAALDVVYTGAYLDRDIDQTVDYIGYNNVGGFIDYYTCTYEAIRHCLDPVKGFIGEQDITRNTHELRVSTPRDQRVRGTAGVFYDDFEIKTLDNWFYAATPELGFAPNAPITAARNIDPSTRPAGIAFFNDITRTEEQIAVFGEVELDFAASWTLTLGGRWYDIESDFWGSSNFTNIGVDSVVEGLGGRDYDSTFGHSTEPLEEDGFVPKVTLSYAASADVLLYSTYSEGFRPGGFNRGGGAPSLNPEFPAIPLTYTSDEVENYEFGWKTRLLAGDLQFNGAVYYVKWSDMQVARFDPINVSILTFIDNAADSEIRGLETDLIWAATEKLTLSGAFSYNDTELVSTKSDVIELAPIGSELALTPKYQANTRAFYYWQWGDFGAHWRAAAVYVDESHSSIVVADRRSQDSYITIDVGMGLEKDNWAAEVFIENLTDERAELFFNVQDDIPRITTNRPLTVGLRIDYSF
jgi:iron complex outermembrane receptor protein